MIGILGSLFSGASLGIIGSAVSKVADLVKRHQDRKHELALKRLDLEMMDKEHAYLERRAEMEGEVRLEESADGLVAASLRADRATYSAGHEMGAWAVGLLVLVDFVRGMIRPLLTVFLIWLVWDTRAEVMGVLHATGFEGMSPERALGLYGMLLELIIFLTSTCVTWWFGSRPERRKKAA